MAMRGRGLVDLSAVLQRGTVELPAVGDAAVRVGLVEVIASRLHRRRVHERGIAALLLGLLRPPDAAGLLLPMLDDRDGDVRLVAAGALGRTRSGKGAAALVAALARHALTPERLIEQLSGPWATPTIIAALTEFGPERADVRAGLARAVGVYGDARVEPVLLSLLVSPAVEERISAARALTTCGTPRCHHALLAAMADVEWQVRAQAAASLGALEVTSAVAVLEVNLGHGSWWVRANCADALARLGLSGFDALRRAASSKDAYAAERAQEVLAFHAPAVPMVVTV
jgi:HEAT repeat protein